MTAVEALWSRVLEARARRHREGKAASTRLDRPVVSVGNITVGGTGKTPIVEHLARWMLQEGRRPAILSRGYGRRSFGVVLVSDGSGRGPLVSPGEGGDEPVQLARKIPGAIVAVARHRVDAAAAASALGPDAYLLDDGFQHLSLERDLDLLLLDAADPFGGRRYPPFGRLREPVSALRRADAIVFTRPRPGAPTPESREEARRANPAAAQFLARIRPAGFTDEAGQPCGAPEGPFIAASGIARPESFLVSLGELGAKPAETLVFSDHRRYVSRDLERIRATAARHGAKTLVTTEKDAVKLSGRLRLPIRSVRLEVEFEERDFLSFVRRRLFGEPAAVGPAVVGQGGSG